MYLGTSSSNTERGEKSSIFLHFGNPVTFCHKQKTNTVGEEQQSKAYLSSNTLDTKPFN